MVTATATVRPSDGPSDEQLSPSATDATERGPASGDERALQHEEAPRKKGVATPVARFGDLVSSLICKWSALYAVPRRKTAGARILALHQLNASRARVLRIVIKAPHFSALRSLVPRSSGSFQCGQNTKTC